MAKEDRKSSDTVKPEDLIPIGRDEIMIMSPLPADFYVRLAGTHFVMVGRKGDAQIQELHALKDGGKVADLFVRRDEFKNCVSVNLQIAEQAVSKAELSDLKKVDFLFKATEGVFREIETIGFNEESLEHSKVVANSVLALVSAKSDLNAVISAMAQISDELLRHCLMVSAVSVSIAKNMGWTMTANMQKLALAALLHDIGMKEVPQEILDKPRHLWTVAEVKLFETHVFRGAEILQNVPDISSEVISVVLEHHENAIGMGYPRHIRDVKMNPFARIVSVADAFCELTSKNIGAAEPRSPTDALHHMEVTLGQPFCKPAFAALKKSLNFTKVRQTG